MPNAVYVPGTPGDLDYGRTVIVDKQGKGDYTTVKAACDYVATQSPGWENQWTIMVRNGLYEEAAFTIPTYTVLVGACPTSSHGWATCRISPVDNEWSGGSFITCGGSAVIANIFLQCATVDGASGDTIMVDAVSGSVMLNNCYIFGFQDDTGNLYTVVKGYVTITKCIMQITGKVGENSRCIHTTDGSRIDYSHITTYRGHEVGLYSDLGGGDKGSCMFTRFGGEDGPNGNPDIYLKSGQLNCNNVAAATITEDGGTIIWSDVPATDVRGTVLKASAVADLSQTITNPPTRGEVQDLSDKVDALLAAARTSGWLAI